MRAGALVRVNLWGRSSLWALSLIIIGSLWGWSSALQREIAFGAAWVHVVLLVSPCPSPPSRDNRSQTWTSGRLRVCVCMLACVLAAHMLGLLRAGLFTHQHVCLSVHIFMFLCFYLIPCPPPTPFTCPSPPCSAPCFLSTRPHTANGGYCISCGVTASSVSSRGRHGGHPAAPRLACRLQPEQHGPAGAVRPPPQRRPEAPDHVRLHLHLIFLHPVLHVTLTCALHLPRRHGLWPQPAAERGTPDQHGLPEHAWLQ